jgi:hypothetical protein
VCSGGALDPRVDFAAQRSKIDGFSEKRLSTALQSFAVIPCSGIDSVISGISSICLKRKRLSGVVHISDACGR